MARRDLIVLVRRPPGAVQVYRLEADDVAFGRDPTCAVQLPDPAIAPVHARLRRTSDGGAEWAGGDRLSKRGAVLAMGPYEVEVTFDEGPGPTSDSLDTGRRARLLAHELAVAAGRGWNLWIGRGEGAGAAVPVPAGRPLHLGDAPESPVRLSGVAPRLLTFEMDDGRLYLEAHGPGALRNGAPIEGRVALAAGDLVEAGGVAMRVTPPAEAPRTEPRWTPLERLTIAAIAVAVSAAVLIVASGW